MIRRRPDAKTRGRSGSGGRGRVPPRRRIGAACTVAAAFHLLFAGVPSLEAQGGVGPLRVSEQNPLYRFLYVPDLESADVVGDGRWGWELSTHYSSVFEEGEGPSGWQLVDLERMANTVTVRYGPGASTELGGQVTLVTGWDGFLDPMVMGFHDLLGIPNGSREDYPENRYRFELEATDGDAETVALDIGQSRFSLEDLRLFGKWRFYRTADPRTVLSVRATARVAGEPFDRGRISGGIAFSGGFSRDRTHVNFALGYAALNPPAELRPIAHGQALFFAHAVERELESGLSLLAQLSGSTRYFRGPETTPLSGVPMLLTLGLGGRVGRDWQWQLGFAEDILFGGPSVDFTVGLTVSHDFGGTTDAEEGRPSPDLRTPTSASGPASD